MLLRISKRVASFWCRNGIITDEYQDAYIYGIQLLLSTAINIFFMIAISWLLGETFAWIPFMIGFVPLRMTAGGYHAKTPLKCGLIFCGTYTLVLILIQFIPAWVQAPVIWINSLITLLLVFLFSPVPTANKPLTAQEIKRNRKRSLKIASISFLVILIADELHFLGDFSFYISFGQTTSAFFLCLSKNIV